MSVSRALRFNGNVWVKLEEKKQVNKWEDYIEQPAAATTVNKEWTHSLREVAGSPAADRVPWPPPSARSRQHRNPSWALARDLGAVEVVLDAE